MRANGAYPRTKDSNSSRDKVDLAVIYEVVASSPEEHGWRLSPRPMTRSCGVSSIHYFDCIRLLALLDAFRGQEVMFSYYLSSLSMGVKRFARAVRSHGGIENSCHWSLDVTYREDESRIRDEHMRENFAWLNRFTLSLLKQHPSKDSIAMKRRSCG